MLTSITDRRMNRSEGGLRINMDTAKLIVSGKRVKENSVSKHYESVT